MRHSALGQLCPVGVSEICHHLQMEEGQHEALWKAPRLLGHHRSLGGRDTLSLFPTMICLQLAEEVARRPVSPVAQGQLQPCQRTTHPASTALSPGMCLQHLLHVTLGAAFSLHSQGEQKPSSTTKYHNRNPRRTWPCTRTCQLSK